MAASAILRVDVASGGPAALGLSHRRPSGLAFLDYKTQGTGGVELCGRLKRPHADTVGVPATACAAATARAASRAGIRQALSRPVESGRLIPLIEEVAGTP
jgi:response regulator RpfG family c-di-GMP phosphodiesterase